MIKKSGFVLMLSLANYPYLFNNNINIGKHNMHSQTFDIHAFK